MRDECFFFDSGFKLFMTMQGGSAWLAIQRPSQFKIQNELSEIRDQRLSTFSYHVNCFICWVKQSGLDTDQDLIPQAFGRSRTISPKALLGTEEVEVSLKCH